MAGIFREGFDTYNGVGVSPGIQSRWASTGSFQSLVAGLIDGTGQALEGAGAASSSMTATMDSAVSSLTICGTLKVIAVNPTPIQNSIGVRSGATWMCGIDFLATGVVSAYRLSGSGAGTLLGSSGNAAYTLNQVHSFALEIVISDTVGRMTLYIDNAATPVLNLTSQDTKNSTPTTVDTIAISNWSTGNGSRISIDDIYVTDSATKPSSWPLRIETIYPTSDGGTLNFTPSTGTSHYAVVDEAQVSTADYLSGTSVGDLDELGMGNLVTTPTTIEEIGVIINAHRTDASARSIAAEVKSGATTSTGSNLALAASVGRLTRTLATDPNTAAAWTGAGVNALLVRPKVTV